MEDTLPQSTLALVCQNSQFSHNPLVQALIQRMTAGN